MRHIKGIKGIQGFKANKAYDTGWHVFLDDEYVAFYSTSNAYDVHSSLERTTRMTITLTGWTGNGLTFISS
jgi:hypothetical protein